MARDRELDTAERIASLEVMSAAHEEDIKSHAEHLKSLDRAVTSLIGEVREIRKAMYVMAAALVANVPVLKDLLTYLKQLL
jgi:hypothetical protein